MDKKKNTQVKSEGIEKRNILTFSLFNNKC